MLTHGSVAMHRHTGRQAFMPGGFLFLAKGAMKKMDDENLTNNEQEAAEDDGMSGEEAHRYGEFEETLAHMREEMGLLREIDAKLDALREQLSGFALTSGVAVADLDGDGDADAVEVEAEGDGYMALEDLDYTIRNVVTED